MQLTEKEMIDLWLLSKGYEPLRTDATIIRTDGVDIRADSPLARRQSAPYAAAGPAAPLAVLRRDGRLELFSMAAGSDTLLSLRCVTLRTDSDGAPIYSFADCALSTI